jgi:hypothetical protein
VCPDNADVARALYVAAGGGGDAIGALLVAAVQNSDDRPAVLTWSWDRLVVNPLPGPREPSRFRHLVPYGRHNWRLTAALEEVWPGTSPLPRLIQTLPATLFLLDPRYGVAGVRRQVAELVTMLQVDRVVVVDVGGDVLAVGTEPELRSPLGDAMVLAACAELPVSASVIVTGPGLDGELSEAYVLNALAELDASVAGRVSADVATAYAGTFEWHPSETTGLLCATAAGIRGIARIRPTGTQLTLSDHGPEVWDVSTDAVLRRNRTAQLIADTATFPDAEDAVRGWLGRTELDEERRLAVERRAPRWRPVPNPVHAAQRLIAMAWGSGADYVTYRCLLEHLRLSDVAQLRPVISEAGLTVPHPPLIACAP